MRSMAACIQALAAVGLLIIGAWTRVILRRYAADTKIIAENSAEQTENSHLPFIALVEREPGHSGHYAIRNQGFGPAINIFFSRVTSDTTTARQALTALAPTEQHFVDNRDVQLVSSESGFYVEYQVLERQKVPHNGQGLEQSVQLYIRKAGINKGSRSRPR
jgi:hypothetical protein